MASIAPELSLPAAGQGAVGIEFREQDDRVRELLAPPSSGNATRVLAERAVVRRLDGGCDVPIAAFAEWEGDGLWLRARVGSADGGALLVAEARGGDPEPGRRRGRHVVVSGAEELIRSARG